MWRIGSGDHLVSVLAACCAVVWVSGVWGNGAWSDDGRVAAPRASDEELRDEGDLEVTLSGVESSEGRVVVALYGSAESFDESEEPLRSARLAPDGELIWRLEEVPFGTYAVKAYHDVDDDGELDRGALGRPTEPYGFSNDARGRFGPPSFEAACFEHRSDVTAIEVELR